MQRKFRPTLLAILVGSLATQLMALDIQQWTTSRGTRVYLVSAPAPDIVDLELNFPAGNIYDDAGQEGLADMTLTLLSAGAQGLSEETIVQRLADSGAQWGFNAEKERATVTLRTLASATQRDDSIALLAKVLSRPTFPEKAFKRERARVVAILEDAETQPDYLANKAFYQTLYGNTPYGRSATAKSVGALTRRDVEKFYQSHISAASATLSIVGKISRQEAEKLAEALTSQLSATKPTVPAVPSLGSGAGKSVTIPHPASQAHVLMGMPLFLRQDPDYFPLLVGNYVLGGGGFVSRLMKVIREKEGLAYSVYSSLNPMSIPGPFEIGLQTQKDNTSRAIALVRQTLDQFLRDGPTDEEVAGAKLNIADGFPLRIENNRKLLGYLGVIAFYRLPTDWLDRYPEQVRAVTREQIKDAYRRRVNPALLSTIVVAGNPS